MRTDQLIGLLASDNAYRPRPVGLALASTLLLAAPVSVGLFVFVLGVRPDFMIAIHNPLFNLKFVVTFAMAVGGLSLVMHLSRPEASLRGRLWLLLIPVGLLAIGIAGEAAMTPSSPMMTRLVGSNSRICMTAIPLIALPVLAGSLIGLRHGASVQPTVSGALAGLFSAGFAATLYAANCTDDSPLFVITWYSVATLAVAAVGALAGSKILRF